MFCHCPKNLIFTSVLSAPLAVSAASSSKYTWNEKKAPNYVVTIGVAKVTNKPKKGKIKYARLDKYGRTGRAVGNITYKMVKDSAGWRQDFEEGSDPAGWGRKTKVEIELYNGRYYRGYMEQKPSDRRQSRRQSV
jgi:hypothetical protein